MMHSTRLAQVGRRARAMVGMVAVAGALLTGASSALASGPGPLEPGRYRDAYESAYVSSLTPDEAGRYLGSTVSLFRNDAGTHVCVDNLEPAIDGGLIIHSGCAPLADSAVQLDKQLTGVTLAPIRITVMQVHCAPASAMETTCTELGTRDLTVAAKMDGVGEVQQTRSRSSYNDGTYTYQFKGSGSYRMASGSVTVSGETQSGTGSLSTSKNLTVIRAN